jgi:hypothetical protein
VLKMVVRLLPAIEAVGLITAGVSLWPLCERHLTLRALRWVAAALALYGAAAFLDASLAGVTLRDALRGSLWRGLPRVFQGAFVGAFVVLPLGWAASLLRAGFPRFRRGSWHAAAYQAIALTLCIALLFTSLPRTRGSSDPEERLAALQNSLRALEERERESPRDRWEPEYVVSVVGREPQRLLEWVRHNTVWVPYRGLLRGATGVLLDRQGNSFDRAALLATLLQRAGLSVRLAHGDLPPEKARSLLPELVARRRFPEPATVALPAKDAPALSTATEADAWSSRAAATGYLPVADAIGAKLKIDEADGVRAARELRSRVAGQTAGLLAALRRPDPSKDWNLRFEAAAKALGDHWWVQLKDGQAWKDLDPLLGSGNKDVVPRETLELSQVPAELHHEISIRVMAEQWSGRALSTRKVLEYAVRPSEVIGQPLVLQFWPTAWLTEPGGYGARHTLSEAASQDQWAAVLELGSRPVAQAFLAETGAAEETRGGVLGGLGGAVSGALGSRTTPRQLSSVWLEYEIRVPGEKPQVVRRTVFDLLGAEARAAGGGPPEVLDQKSKLTRALALMMRTEIAPISSEVPPEYVQHLVAQSVLANRELLAAVAGDELAPSKPAARAKRTEADPPERSGLQKHLTASPGPVSPLLALASARLQSGSVVNPAFIDRPNILTRHRFFAPVENEVAALDAIDVVANEVGVDLGQPEAFPVRLWQGVLDTNLEAHVEFGAPSANVGTAFAGTNGWVVLQPAQRSRLESMSLPLESRRRIAGDLDRGYVVVSPDASRGEQSVGWWRINPSTGDTLGIGANGWGTSLTEQARLTQMANTFGYYFLQAYAVCESFPLAVNAIRVINEKYFGAWHPSWTGPGPKSKNPLDVVDFRNAETRACLLTAITLGFIATLPLLLMTLNGSRAMTELEALEAEELAARERVDPHANTERGVNPEAKTERQPESTELDPNAPKSGDPPPGGVDPEKLEEAREIEAVAKANNEEASQQSAEAVGKYARYRAEHRIRGPNEELSWDDSFDPGVDKANWEDAVKKHLESIKASRTWEDARRILKILEGSAKGPGKPGK